MNTDEIFYPLKGWEDYFEINKLGVVRSKPRSIIDSRGISRILKGKILTPFKKNNGYMSLSIKINEVSLKQFGFMIHRLLAIQFIPNPSNLPQVNHKNAIRDDNRLENLEWCDSQYNNQYKFDNGYIVPMRRLTEDQVYDIYHNTKITYGKYNRPGTHSLTEMCHKYNFDKHNIIKILKKKSYKEIVVKFIDIDYYGFDKPKQK